jgi:hypothetical protein
MTHNSVCPPPQHCGHVVATANALNAVSMTEIVEALEQDDKSGASVSTEGDPIANKESNDPITNSLAVHSTKQGVRFWIVSQVHLCLRTVLLPEDRDSTPWINFREVKGNDSQSHGGFLGARL